MAQTGVGRTRRFPTLGGHLNVTRWMVMGFVALGLVATSCSDYRDAIVFNPCSTAARVSFSGTDRPAGSPEGWFGTSAIPPERAITLDALLADVGEGPFWVRIDFRGVAPHVEPIPFPFPPDEAAVPVLIPARLCP